MSSETRKRDVDEAGEPIEIDIVRSSKFWFDDGSVVLQVDRMQFCVHSSLLSRQSTVLQDLFTVPQPEDGERVDGRPLVRLLDKATDWENVLGCLYNGLNLRSDMKEYFPQGLVSMLRLGDKYLFDEIKSFAVQYLKQEFPTIFREWVNRTPRFSTTRHLGYEIDLINIAVELKMTSILPALGYLFLRDREPNEIFDGTTRVDGTVARLEPYIQRSLALGRNKILNAVMLLPLYWCTGYDQEDELLLCCVDQRHQYLREVAPTLSQDVSRALDLWGNRSEVELAGFCSLCRKDIERNIKVGCREIWEALPSYFDLPPWDVLKQHPVDTL